MTADDNRFVCACTIAGKPLLCRSCQRRAGLQQRRARTGYHAQSQVPVRNPASKLS